MIMPVMMLMIFLCFTKNCMIAPLAVLEIAANISKGVAMPMPNAIKPSNP